MARLKPTQDSRTTYDPQNGAVRSFFGTELVEEPPAGMAAFATKATSEKAGEFLAANKDLFNLDKVTVMAADRREGTATESLRYRQEHEALPVWGAELVVGIEKIWQGRVGGKQAGLRHSSRSDARQGSTDGGRSNRRHQ
jgi:hypothetical protein